MTAAQEGVRVVSSPGLQSVLPCVFEMFLLLYSPDPGDWFSLCCQHAVKFCRSLLVSQSVQSGVMEQGDGSNLKDSGHLGPGLETTVVICRWSLFFTCLKPLQRPLHSSTSHSCPVRAGGQTTRVCACCLSTYLSATRRTLWAFRSCRYAHGLLLTPLLLNCLPSVCVCTSQQPSLGNRPGLSRQELILIK